MKVVVGLGNPGAKYHATRHNVGFDVADVLARRHAAPPYRTKFESQIAEIAFASHKVLLVCPQTFMNLSGRAVQPLVDFYMAHGPTSIHRQAMLPQTSIFGLEGYLVMLVGQQVPYSTGWQPSSSELETLQKHRRQYAAIGENGCSISECLAAVRHPNWKW